MLQICDFFSRIYMTFQGPETHNSIVEGVSAHGKKAVMNSAVVPEVDSVTDYCDYPET